MLCLIEVLFTFCKSYLRVIMIFRMKAEDEGAEEDGVVAVDVKFLI